MTLWRQFGLRGRLVLALAAATVISVALATVLANNGLHGRLDQFARARLQDAASHSAELAGGLYRAAGDRWTRGIAIELEHVAEMNGYRIAVAHPDGKPVGEPASLPQSPRATASVIVVGEVVGVVTVTPLTGGVQTDDDRALRHRLNRLHLLAGAFALGFGLLVAMLLASALARPLRRLTEAARRIQLGDLHARVAPSGAPEFRQLGESFNHLAETLEREEEIRGEAAADIAHELRTPLAGIVSRIEAAQDGVLPDERRNLDAMHTEALRLTRLVEDLGMLAEAQQPGLTLHKELVDLRELVHERAHVYHDYLEAKGVALVEQLDAARVYGDRGRLAQIVDNLLSNALRYTDAGGTVTIDLNQCDREVLLEVRDTGIGIRGEDLPYIFERFWRGEPSRARSTGGAGIGLAIVRALVSAHDGRIDVTSHPGQGSRFRVTLPLATPAA